MTNKKKPIRSKFGINPRKLNLLKNNKLQKYVHLARAANNFQSLRHLKDDRNFILKNVDESDKQFLEDVEEEDKRIEERVQREVMRLSSHLNQRVPSYISEIKDKKKNVVTFQLAPNKRDITIKEAIQRKTNLQKGTNSPNLLIANHSEMKDFSKIKDRIKSLKIKQ